ncbi:putative pyrimidine monooxygenase ruta [Mytilinidion resinicola]|uniref:Pyrimidine monooxygenase ruta n=1 Tax=Mytilinidion resinicola TaxID=574789 RepID=A0A6A6YRW8_9PEZI|nr:putative pyrimidine monooxygenase ruta [Mytilinidion resinicola]KAF2811259.1 putative pyrimidine monooxygenase ruta [Mytilinidion resinicola]
MEIGVFIPIGNNGWLISTNSPQYMPSFELNKAIVLKAEKYNLDFALSMIKLRGFGGKTEFWDHNLESFTLMAGLAAVTTKIKLFASTAILTLPPALVARMATTIDSIAPGRFGINIVTGWQEAEYSQMNIWPGNAYFGYRYDYATEYVQVMKELWTTGVSNFKGKHFTMTDCKMSPPPAHPINIVAAGQSGRGLEFASENADFNFVMGQGINTPTKVKEGTEKLVEASKKAGKDCGAYVLFMVIADETDEMAQATWQSYREGADVDALAWMADQGGKDEKADGTSTAKTINLPEGAVNLNMGTLVGSYETVAGLLDEAAETPGTKGIMLTFDDFLVGMDKFGEKIQPLMKCRAKVAGGV